jgi:hypothetical protein
VGAAQRLPLGLAGSQAPPHEPPAALDGLDLAEDRLDGAAAQAVAGLALGAVQPGTIAARRPSLLDSDGLPSLRGLPWRPWRAGGIRNSGAPGIAERLAIDQ